jgi:hypothetical protein
METLRPIERDEIRRSDTQPSAAQEVANSRFFKLSTCVVTHRRFHRWKNCVIRLAGNWGRAERLSPPMISDGRSFAASNGIDEIPSSLRAHTSCLRPPALRSGETLSARGGAVLAQRWQAGTSGPSRRGQTRRFSTTLAATDGTDSRPGVSGGSEKSLLKVVGVTQSSGVGSRSPLRGSG